MPRGRQPLNVGPGGIVGHQLAVDVRFAHAPHDELAVLRSEVDDDDGFFHWSRPVSSTVTVC